MPAKRPASMTFLGITNVVFGALALIGSGFALYLLFGGATNMVPQGGLDLQAVLTERFEWYDGYAKTSAFASIPVALTLLASGIGLLQVKSWGRTLSNIYGVVAILTALVTLYINTQVVMPVMTELAQMNDSTAANGAEAGISGATGGSCLALGYPLILLIFVNRHGVKEAIREHAAQQPGVSP